MTIEDKVNTIYEARYAANGLTERHLMLATQIIAKELALSDEELERRLDNLIDLVKKFPGPPTYG